jgi:hypothetical protein
MCLAFYQTRFSQQSRYLTRRCNSQVEGVQGAWHAVRRLIGRLGSWHKSTKVVLEQAMRNSHLKKGPTVRSVDGSRAMKFDFDPASFTLASAVEQTFHSRNGDYALGSVKALFGQQQLDLEAAFKKRKEWPFQPKVHAELGMADHFSCWELEFWGGDC